MKIGSPGTFNNMIANHEARDGYQRVADLQQRTQEYIQGGNQILQDDINTRRRLSPVSCEIVRAIDRDAQELAQETELWRALRPPKPPKGNAMRRYQRILDKEVDEIIRGGGIPFSTSSDPLLSAIKFGRYTREDGEERLGIIIKTTVPAGTPVVITNSRQAEYIIGSGYALKIESIKSNVLVELQHFQHNDGTPGSIEKIFADRVIYDNLVEAPKPKGL